MQIYNPPIDDIKFILKTEHRDFSFNLVWGVNQKNSQGSSRYGLEASHPDEFLVKFLRSLS